MRNGLISVLLAAMLAAPACAAPPLTTPVLASVDNFRDVAGISSLYGGGTADPAAMGYFRPGLVYRANALRLSPADKLSLQKLGIGEDIDLRTPAEIQRQPDELPPGVRFINVNIFGVEKLPKLNLASADAANQEFEEFYRDFVVSPVERQNFRTTLLDIANAKTAIVFHCSAGKDRSGWLAALLQTIAGVPQPLIMRDYLASNAYTSARVQAALAKMPPDKRAVYAVLMSVQPQFLNAALKAAQQNYGSMQGYLTQGLGLTPDQLAALRGKLSGT